MKQVGLSGDFLEWKLGREQAEYEQRRSPLTHDNVGRRLVPEPMPEALKDAIATCYGLLHGVTTDDKRVHRARRGLLQWLTKDEQARGIDMARGVLTLAEDRETPMTI